MVTLYLLKKLAARVLVAAHTNNTMELKKKNKNGGLTNRQIRKNSRFQTKAAGDAAMVTRGAKDSKDLMKNLSQYDEKKNKRAIVKQMIKAGAIALGGAALSNLRYPQDAAGMSMAEYIKELRRLNR